MATIPASQKTTIADMYSRGMCMKQIGDTLGYSLNAVYYFMRKHQIRRRDLKASAATRFAQKAPSFTIKIANTQEADLLKHIGAVLYWAEGYKTEKSAGIDFANSDPAMVSIFLRFLRETFNLDESRFRILLYSHNSKKIPTQIQFWSDLLKIPKKNFSKPYIAKNKQGLEKKPKMPYGLVHLRYADKKLLWYILDLIEELKNDHCVEYKNFR
jgi:hypothetical protein